MPLKKPKAPKLPSPFRDLAASGDSDTRRRAVLMTRELDRAGGFSWDAEQPTLAQRIRRSRARLPFLAGAAAMGAMLVLGFIVAADTGFRPEPRIVYVDNWSARRTAEEAVADRAADMADYYRRYAAQEAAAAATKPDPQTAASAAAAAEAAAAAARTAEEAALAAAQARERAAARAATPR
jgi:hypothetical protein